MRERIWSELTQARHSLEFAILYLGRQRIKQRIFNILVLLFSSSGILGWQIWNNFPYVVCIIISIVSLVRLIQPYIIMGEKQIMSLDDIHKFYFDYYNRLEKLWFDFESSRIDEAIAAEKFYELKNSEGGINSTVNEIIRSQPKEIVAKAKMHTESYLKIVFKTQ